MKSAPGGPPVEPASLPLHAGVPKKRAVRRVDRQRRAERVLRELRPTDWTPELGQALCRLVAAGASPTEGCKRLGLAPSTPWGWCRDARCEGFAADWQLAQEQRAEVLVGQLTDIADQLRRSKSREASNAARLQVMVRQWIAERVLRRKYAPSATLSATIHGDPSAPITVALARARVESRLDELAGELPPPEPAGPVLEAQASPIPAGDPE